MAGGGERRGVAGDRGAGEGELELAAANGARAGDPQARRSLAAGSPAWPVLDVQWIGSAPRAEHGAELRGLAASGTSEPPAGCGACGEGQRRGGVVERECAPAEPLLHNLAATACHQLIRLA